MRAMVVCATVLMGIKLLVDLCQGFFGGYSDFDPSYGPWRLLGILGQLSFNAACLSVLIGFLMSPRSSSLPSMSAAGETAWQPSRVPMTRRIAKGLYLGFMIGADCLSMLLMIPLFLIFIEGRGRDQEAVLMLLPFAMLPMVLAVVFKMIALYKIWATIQGGPARTTPGRAVGFLFIPLFNIYWMFEAYWGWAKDFNQLVATRRLAVPRVPEGLALTICILPLLSWIPILGFLAAAINFVLVIVFFNLAINGANAVIAQTASVPAT